MFFTKQGDILEDDPLRDFFVFWDNINQSDLNNFNQILDNSTKESEVQNYLEKNPVLLIQHFGGGHGRWVIPQKRLGSEFICDFMIGEKSSNGFRWQVVELENPNIKMFNKDGDPSKMLNHAIRQIKDWREWLEKNQNYASRAKAERGLGLTDISPMVEGLVLIGRRGQNQAKNISFIRQTEKCDRIAIHTYDFLLGSW